jgi:drug/metabolite transporter (DMT)-like permease
LLAAALANLIVFNGVRLLGPTRIITLQSLVPAMAVVLAFLFLREPIRPVQVVGGVIIVAGVALTRYASRRPARGPA